MADLSQLSDEELDSRLKAKGVSDMSDAELDAAIEKKLGGAKLGGQNESVLQESPEELSYGTRFVAKNLVTKGPEAQAQYIQQEMPDFETRVQDGDVQLRKKGEAAWKVLDPGWRASLTSPTEWARDAGDFTKDILKGGASALAGTGAALAALPTTGGLGSVPAAMAASGATAAGIEAGAQQLGNLLGVKDNTDLGAIGLDAALGAAGPLAFGSGVAKEAVKGTLAQTLHQGLVPAAVSKAFPGVASGLSGVPSQTIKALRDKLPFIQKLDEEGSQAFTSDIIQKLRSAISASKREVGAQMDDIFEKSGLTVDISKAKSALKNRISELQSSVKRAASPENKAELDAAEQVYKNIFTEEIPGKEVAATIDPIYGHTISPAKTVGAVIKETPDKVPASRAFEIQQQLKRVMDLGENKFAVGKDAVEALNAGAAGNGYGAINDAFEAATGGVSKELKGQYKKVLDLQKRLANSLSNEDRAFRNLSDLGAYGKRNLFKTIEKLDKARGTNILDDAATLDAFKTFGKEASDKIALQPGKAFVNLVAGRPRGAILGGLAGHTIGEMVGSPWIGTVLGGAAGAKALAPEALRFYLESAGPALTTGARTGLPIWEKLYNQVK